MPLRKTDACGSYWITCARLGHAKAILLHGITHILVANEIAGESMIKRFVEISRQASVILAVDNPLVVSGMARLAGHDGGAETNVEMLSAHLGVLRGTLTLTLETDERS